MQTRGRVMLFSYMYIVGVALGFLYPQPQGYTRIYWLVTALLGLGWLAVTLLRRRGARLAISWFYVFMCLFAAMFGMTRYNQDFSVPDEVYGRVQVEAQQTLWTADRPISELHRLRVQKLTATTRDLVLVISGVRDSTPVVARVAVSAADSPGVSYPVDEPFTEVKGVTSSVGDPAEFVIYAVSNHLSAFSVDDPLADPVEVEGIINIDPDLYDDKAKIQLEVEAIRPVGADYFFPCSGGLLQATIKPQHEMYKEITQLEACGWRVKMRGVLLTPAPLTNPGGFDFKRYLNNSGMYAAMNLRPPRGDEPPSLEIVEKSDASPVIELSLFIKDRMLRVFKQTMPYPESAFLGGVTLGMRYGLSNAMTPFNGKHLTLPDWLKAVLPGRIQHILTGGTNLTIPAEFQWAGINHVLAVSGLHVSIITIMFWGIFTTLRVPPKIYAPLMVLALLIFAIITGYRPSTQRAALMNSIAVLSTVYMGKGLRAGILFTIPFSGLLVLLFQPLLIVEPSLTLSYFAVLSLGLMTTPCQRLLSRLRGWTFVAFLGGIFVWTVVGCLHWPLVAANAFWMPFLALFVAAMYGAGKLNERMPTFTYGYSDIPLWFAGFFAAQFGIQFGMMIPLSSYYFGSWPLAGAYANFIAIPLIGIIVQLGMMAGIAAIILPWFNIGTYIALLLNATNFFLSKLFVAVGHYSVMLFPYPTVIKYTPSQVFFIFAVIACFIWHQAILVRLRSWALAARADARFRVKFYGLSGTVGLAALVWFGSFFYNSRSELEMTVLSVRYGESILLEAPDRSDILINGGSFVKEGNFDNGRRTILPFLSKKLIRTLDWMVVSTLNPECFAGLHTVLANCYVDNLLVPYDPQAVRPGMPEEEFLNELGGATLARQASLKTTETLYREVVAGYPELFKPSFAELLTQRNRTMWNRWAGWTVNARRGLAAGATGEGISSVVNTVIDGVPYTIDVLSPARLFLNEPLDDNSLVLRVGYGRTAFLLTSDIGIEALDSLLALPAEKVQADVLVFPRHGTLDLSDAQCAMLLDKVKPQFVIFSYSRDRANPRDYDDIVKRNLERCVARLGAANCFRTDAHGAVIVTSDGERVKVDTMAARENRSVLAVSDDVVSAIDVTY